MTSFCINIRPAVKNIIEKYLKGRLWPIGRKMSNNRFLRFLNGKGFYVALGICMIAIGVSAWSAIDKATTPPEDILSSDTAELTVSSDTSSADETETEVNKEQEGVEDDREASSDYTAQPESNNEDDVVSELEGEEISPTAGYFVYPVAGEVIKKFSSSELQYSVTFNDMRLHKGVDIKVDAGSDVKSAGDGRVLEVKNDVNLGYTVKIDHGNGMVAVYAGLDKGVLVKAEDVVTAGAKLGVLGTVNNECLDAPHLHLEFFKDGEAVDPLDYLN